MKHRLALYVALAIGPVALASPVGCGGADTDAAVAGAGGAGARAGGAGKAGGGSKPGAAGATAGKAGASAAGGQATAGTSAAAGCADFVGSNDGYVTVPPCPTDYTCGPGCRPVFSVSYDLNALSEFQLDASGVADTTRQRLLVAKFGDEQTYSVGLPVGENSIASPMLTESYLIGRHYSLPAPADSKKQTELRVWDRATGALLKTIPMPGTTNATSPYYYGGASTDKYTLFSFGGTLRRFDLATGTSKAIAPSTCQTPQILAGRYTCMDENTGKFTSIDIETGDLTHPGAGPELQVEGRCSVDGASCAWVDYRDPPGPGSNFSWRFGGEIYLYTFATKTLERITFDSTDTPTWKFHAAVDGDLVAWMEVSMKSTQRDETRAWISIIDRVAKYDRKSGQRCTYAVQNVTGRKFIGSIVHNRKLYGTFNDPDMTGYLRVVALDLDSADIPWVCAASPSPVVVP
ncbi:MAG: hypothetical protein IT374_03760 [Polyangiaceae bacterium]|nr:hypothetical protein [Polyangiaceae bacterium]